MNEDKETETEGKTAKTTSDSNEGNQSEADDALTKLNTATERMEAQNDRRLDIIEREERMVAEGRLGGESEGGKPSKKAKPTDEDITNDFMEGKLKVFE